MPTPKPKSGYKTKRKYSCPYCDKKLIRSELVTHIQDEHEIMIPEGYTAARVVYDHINGKNYGTCMICGAKVYEWDDRIWRYKNLCDNPKCREILTDKAKGNHLDDPEKQKQMLQGRKISGEYKFRDGGKKSYVGSYEKKTLEFMDRVMNIPSKDIETPGPCFEYEYDGETHTWITDIFYIPAMLVIDVKDGGKNPNTRPMESYREKQIEKEKAITEDGKYNYLRLTDNDFGQLLSAVADIRYGDVVNDPFKGIYINEGSSPAGNVMIGSVKPYGRDYIIPRKIHNTFIDDEDEPDTFIFGNTLMEKGFMVGEDGSIIVDTIENLLENTKTKAGDQRDRKVVFNKNKSNMFKLARRLEKERYKKKEKEREKKNKAMMQLEFANILYGRDVFLTPSMIYCLEDTTVEYLNPAYDPILESIFTCRGVIVREDFNANTGFIKSVGKHMKLMYSPDDGYYISSEDPKYSIASAYYPDQEDIPQNVIDLMDNLYEANKKEGNKE